MPTTMFTSWYDETMPELPGMVQAMALNAIKQAAIEFCDRSLVWRVDQGPIGVAPAQNVYEWEPPANTDPARAMQVWLAGIPLEPKTAGELSERYGDFMYAEGTPLYFVQDQPAELIIVPTPITVPSGRTLSSGRVLDGITAKLAIKPKQAATGLETWIAEKYRTAIADGAKARLFKVPKKPWTDKQAAADYQARFDAAIANAQLAGVRGHAGARARTRPQFL